MGKHGPSSKEPLRFRLFVSREASNHGGIARGVVAFCAERGWPVEVIDVDLRRDLAFEARVLATPTLLKVHPEPTERWVGELTQPRLEDAFGSPEQA